jgi:hypothetical protein
MMTAYFTNLDFREMQETDGGLIWLVALVVLLFVLAVPCCVIWSLLRQRLVKGSVDMAGEFTVRAFQIILMILVALPLCLVVVLVPFAVLNMIGSAIFDQEFYWPFLAPGLFITLAVPGIFLVRMVRSDRREEQSSRNA